MKLLILLIALLVCSNLGLSKPIRKRHVFQYREILNNLQAISKELKGKTTGFTHSINITTPHGLNNACDCEAQFHKHLNESINKAINLLPEVFDYMANILDTLSGTQPGVKKGTKNSCNFHKHTIHNRNEINNTLMTENIHFIQKWNMMCK